MTGLLCLSPTLLDQSFPRNLDEAQRVGIALGEIQLCLEANLAHLIITEPLSEVVEIFEWNRPDLNEAYPILQVIYSLLTQWFLQPHEKIVRLNVPDDVDYIPHPIPKGSEKQGLVDDWAEEVGKLYSAHEEVRRRREFFIGIACDYAFAGEKLNVYNENMMPNSFPLIGPESVVNLSDAYEPILPNGINNVSVSFRDAYNNCKVLGATNIETPMGGSHYKVKFPTARRPWVLDRNTDPIPVRFLRELIPITGYGLEVIKYILTTGNLPEYRIRLYKYCTKIH